MAADPYVREVGAVSDIYGVVVRVGVDYDSVTVAGHHLERNVVEAFAELFVAACWEAGANARKMAEASDG